MIIDKFIRIFLPESTRFVTPFKFLQEGKYILPHHAHLNHKIYWKEVCVVISGVGRQLSIVVSLAFDDSV